MITETQFNAGYEAAVKAVEQRGLTIREIQMNGDNVEIYIADNGDGNCDTEENQSLLIPAFWEGAEGAK